MDHNVVWKKFAIQARARALSRYSHSMEAMMLNYVWMYNWFCVVNRWRHDMMQKMVFTSPKLRSFNVWMPSNFITNNESGSSSGAHSKHDAFACRLMQNDVNELNEIILFLGSVSRHLSDHFKRSFVSIWMRDDNACLVWPSFYFLLV